MFSSAKFFADSIASNVEFIFVDKEYKDCLLLRRFLASTISLMKGQSDL